MGGGGEHMWEVINDELRGAIMLDIRLPCDNIMGKKPYLWKNVLRDFSEFWAFESVIFGTK